MNYQQLVQEINDKNLAIYNDEEVNFTRDTDSLWTLKFFGANVKLDEDFLVTHPALGMSIKKDKIRDFLINLRIGVIQDERYFDYMRQYRLIKLFNIQIGMKYKLVCNMVMLLEMKSQNSYKDLLSIKCDQFLCRTNEKTKSDINLVPIKTYLFDGLLYDFNIDIDSIYVLIYSPLPTYLLPNLKVYINKYLSQYRITCHVYDPYCKFDVCVIVDDRSTTAYTRLSIAEIGEIKGTYTFGSFLRLAFLLD